MSKIDGHTKGPWIATYSDPAEGFECWWISSRGKYEKDLATVNGGKGSAPNAALIAAAPLLPEMAEALRKRCANGHEDACTGDGDCDCGQEEARAILARYDAEVGT